jgi:hypothetical protein
MVNFGGNHDGTVIDDASGNDGLNLAQRLDDAAAPLGRNGGHNMLSPQVDGNGGHQYYGRGFLPSGGGNGHFEQQIVPSSQLVAEVNRQSHGECSIHERLGPQPGFQHNSETRAFHTPPDLPPGAGYGHAPSAPIFPPTSGNGPALFVPTPGGVAFGPQAPGWGSVASDLDPLQALAANLHANLAQSIQAGIQQYLQAQGGAPAAPPPRLPRFLSGQRLTTLPSLGWFPRLHEPPHQYCTL